MVTKIISGIIAIAICQLIPAINFVQADEIYLKNKDRVTGKIIEEDEHTLVIETQALGLVSVKKEFIEKVSLDEEIEVVETQDDGPLLWERRISLGYNKTSGNTQNAQSSLMLLMHRKTTQDEFHISADSYYSSSNKKNDAQQWNGMLRYAYSFWRNKWYNFYKLEGNHDRFANISYRIIPSVGLGYWFSDQDDWKAMFEVGAGLEYTNYRDATKDENEAVIIPRAFLEKRLIHESKISQDISFFSSPDNASNVRLHSETALSSPLTDKLSLRFSFIDDYNSAPAQGVKKNDFKFISSLDFSF